MGETATVRSRAAVTASRTSLTASTGSMEMSGFDGAMTTHSAWSIASSTPGPGLASSAPSKRMARTGTECCRCTKYSWKPISVGRPSSPSIVSMVRSRSSVAGSSTSPSPQPAVTSAVTCESGAPSRRRAVR